MKRNKLGYWITIYSTGIGHVFLLKTELFRLIIIGVLIICSMIVYAFDTRNESK